MALPDRAWHGGQQKCLCAHEFGVVSLRGLARPGTPGMRKVRGGASPAISRACRGALRPGPRAAVQRSESGERGPGGWPRIGQRIERWGIAGDQGGCRPRRGGRRDDAVAEVADVDREPGNARVDVDGRDAVVGGGPQPGPVWEERGRRRLRHQAGGETQQRRALAAGLLGSRARDARAVSGPIGPPPVIRARGMRTGR